MPLNSKNSVMVPKVSQSRLTYLFVEGLKESIWGSVSALDPTILEEAIQKASRLEITSSKAKPIQRI